MERPGNPFKAYAGLSTAIYVVAELIDLATTYLLSPDLALESNLLVRWYGFGWNQLLLVTAFSSVIMLIVQAWMWRRLFTFMPAYPVPYRSLYRDLLFGGPGSSYAAGALMGLAYIVAYALIASKLLTCVWNLTLLNDPASTQLFLHVMLTKNLLAAGFGLGMFYLYPFFLNRRQSSEEL